VRQKHTLKENAQKKQFFVPKKKKQEEEQNKKCEKDFYASKHFNRGIVVEIK
jgi:hypothetical protein